jgi:2-oxoglutarate dehydrogenase E2 component (dihydrolipoamide succinyltransferase)
VCVKKYLSSIISKGPGAFSRNERREKISRMRLKIAQRLKEAQNTYALLTTFQEVELIIYFLVRKKRYLSFKKKFLG